MRLTAEVVLKMLANWKKFKQVGWGLGLFLVGLFLVSCGNKDVFTQPGTTDQFVQNYNPEYLDVLWVVDNRSNMTYSPYLNNLKEEARKFFIRLDSTASRQYRMAFADMDGNSGGALRPRNNAVILRKNLGSVSERADYFRSIFGSVINLAVSGLNQGLQNAASALSQTFVPVTNVPLVMVFISDSNDRSNSAGDPVESFANQYLQAKGNNPDLLRVYSVNYTSGGDRCFTRYQADIDTQTNFDDRYFRLADRLGGAKADICSSWADSIDLSGLRLRQLPKRFKLTQVPVGDSLKVSIVSSTQAYENIPFVFDAATNEIVFDAAPPEGSSIVVTYHTN